MKTKEELYDELVSPLMEQVIEICKEHKIAALCSFGMEDEDGEEACCTTALLTDEFDPPECLVDAVKVIYPPKPSPLMMTVTGPGSKKTIAAFL